MPTALELIQVITPSVLSLPVLALALPPAGAPAELPGIRAITVKTVTPRRGFILLCLVLLAATCAAETLVLIADVLSARYRDPEGGRHSHSAWFVAASAAHALGGLCIYSLAAIFAEFRLRWGDKMLVLLSVVAWGLEVPYLVLSVIREVHVDPFDRIFAILNIPPSCLRLILLPILTVLVLNPVIKFQPADERTGLLASSDADAESNDNAGDATQEARGRHLTTQYGTFAGSTRSRDTSATRTTTQENPSASAPPTPNPSGKNKIHIPKKLGEKKEETQGLTWKAFMDRLWKLWPHLWPSTSWKLQVCCVLCVGLILVGRAVNALVPQTIGVFVRALTANEHGGNGPSPWPSLILYIALRSMQSGGVIAFLQNVIWVPVQQYADREMQLLCFNHLLDLSLAFHTKRNTGEVLRIIDRGSAINNLFQSLLFNAAPTVLDILVYSSIFFHLYGPFLSGFMVVIMAAYVTFSIVFTGYRTRLRREMVERDVKTRGIASDVLTNWESVKYFTAESRETRRFTDAILAYQVTEAKVTVSFNLLNLVQSFIITLGLLMGSVIISWQILHGPWDSKGQPDAASFVVFLMYLQQLYQPLDRLGTLYRQLNANATDAEKLFNLLSQPTEIKDAPGAKDLVITDGVIEFDNVCFSYDKKTPALKGVSFRIGKGESMALVGESGSGKSTILRLLYRFYDIDSGVIRIDGQDISKVTQSSLRRAIGIVPQDSVLWNDTIGANISYGKEGADDDEIIAAAQAAKLHDRILSFPEGYSTIVGERGVRLSGGEKQRVSLARMFLKSPAILVLDEATSALDTETEREIQKALAELAKGRSSLSIAHRLSTIINSHQIVVMKEGSVIEHGSYQELIQLDGQFSTMWKKQIFTDEEMLAAASTAAAMQPLPSSSEHSFPLEPAEVTVSDVPPPAVPFSLDPIINLHLNPPPPSDDGPGLVIQRASPPSTVAENDEDEEEERADTTFESEPAQLDTPVARVVELAAEPPVDPTPTENGAAAGKPPALTAFPAAVSDSVPDTPTTPVARTAPKPESVKATSAKAASVKAESVKAEPVVEVAPATPPKESTPTVADAPVVQASPAEHTVSLEVAAESSDDHLRAEPAFSLEPAPSPASSTTAGASSSSSHDKPLPITPVGTVRTASPPIIASVPLSDTPQSSMRSTSPPHMHNPLPKRGIIAFPDDTSSNPPSILERPDSPLKRANSQSPSKRNSVVAFPSDLSRPSPRRNFSTGNMSALLGGADRGTPSPGPIDGSNNGTVTPPPDGKPRRKRLSSIKGFVRRLSTDQTSVVPMSRSQSTNNAEEGRETSKHKKRMSFDDKRIRRRSFQGT